MRIVAGALAGAGVAAAIAAAIKPLFHVPTGGVGYVTVFPYPKGWDYAVVALLVLGSFAGSVLLYRAEKLPQRSQAPRWLPAAIAIVIVTILLRDDPSRPLDFFHEGEHLTPTFAVQSGARPYGDVFFNHGFFADAGVYLFTDSIGGARRVDVVLGALTLALLAPIAAEVCATTAGLWAAVFASLCAIGIGIPGMFPHFRLAPVLIATLALLRYARTQHLAWLIVAACVAAAGLVWSLDTGMYALAGTAICAVVLARAKALLVLPALLVPVVIVLLMRGDLRQFARDSFVILPRSADAIGSTPAPDPPRLSELHFWLADEPARYYIPLIVYGALLAVAFRARAMNIAILTIFSLLLFRAAAGRADPLHIRFAMPLLGIVVVAFIIEPLIMRSRAVATVIATTLAILILNVVPNLTLGAGVLRSWPERHRTSDPIAPDIVADLAALEKEINTFGPEATFFDFSNSLASYYLVGRKPPVRCPDVKKLSAPELKQEALAQLRAKPPAFVILEGYAPNVDGIPNRTRVPELARWIDANYPRQQRLGKFLIASRPLAD